MKILLAFASMSLIALSAHASDGSQRDFQDHEPHSPTSDLNEPISVGLISDPLHEELSVLHQESEVSIKDYTGDSWNVQILKIEEFDLPKPQSIPDTQITKSQ